jgi:hypothetical protein
MRLSSHNMVNLQSFNLGARASKYPRQRGTWLAGERSKRRGWGVFRCGLVVPQGGIRGMNGEGGGMASLYLLGTFPVLRSISADRARRRCFFLEKKTLRSLVDGRTWMRKESGGRIDENIGVRCEWRLGNFTTAVPRIGYKG